jgi:hypothetical protein
MELMDGDEIKRELIRKSAHHREEIEGEFKLISENTEKIITNALIIGGSLALTYFLVRQLSGSSKKKSKNKTAKIKLVQGTPSASEVEETESASPGMVGQLGAALASQASLFLLNLAKEKLMEYLAERAEKKQAE